MRLARVTSCRPVSSGTFPISLRYMRTGSKLPPSLRVGPGRGLASLRETGSGSFAAARPTGTGRRRSAARLASSARRGAGGRAVARAPAAFVLAFELLGDLVDDLDARALDPRVDRGELGGLGLETGERGEDLAGGDEAALLHAASRPSTARRPCRRAGAFDATGEPSGCRRRSRPRRRWVSVSRHVLLRRRIGRRSTLPTARRSLRRLPSRSISRRVIERVEVRLDLDCARSSPSCNIARAVVARRARRCWPERARSVSGSSALRAPRPRAAEQRSRPRASLASSASCTSADSDSARTRSARDRIDEQGRVQPVGHQLGLVDRPPQDVELAPVDRVGGDAAHRVADRRLDSSRAGRRRAAARTASREPVGVDVELARQLHDVLVAHELARDARR